MCFRTSHDCESTLTRFVWAGDQLLWELRVPGGNEVVGSGLESTSATGDFYGRVSYFHAGGIDKPLLITKEGVESVVPRETWRGQFHKGTSPATGLVRDCPIGGQTGCLLIAWPGMQTNAAHSWGGEQPDIRVWYGGLVDGMRDASGQMYMRNRYYDPATGQFTQTDPIGIAGGLNAYGFAAGDPVSYSDPYGLCPKVARLAPAALADGPVPAVDGLLAVACVAELAVLGVRAYRTAQILKAATSTLASSGADADVDEALDELEGEGDVEETSRLRHIDRTADDVSATDAFDTFADRLGADVRTSKDGLTRVIDLPGGGTASVRPMSNTGPPTVQVNPAGGKPIKIRFNTF